MVEYNKELEKKLENFKTASEWSDFVSLLSSLEKIITKMNKIENLRELPLISLQKRLILCLNPALPAGVHNKVIKIIGLILDKIQPPNLLAEDISKTHKPIFEFLERWGIKPSDRFVEKIKQIDDPERKLIGLNSIPAKKLRAFLNRNKNKSGMEKNINTPKRVVETTNQTDGFFKRIFSQFSKKQVSVLCVDETPNLLNKDITSCVKLNGDLNKSERHIDHKNGDYEGAEKIKICTRNPASSLYGEYVLIKEPALETTKEFSILNKTPRTLLGSHEIDSPYGITDGLYNTQKHDRSRSLDSSSCIAFDYEIYDRRCQNSELKNDICKAPQNDKLINKSHLFISDSKKNVSEKLRNIQDINLLISEIDNFLAGTHSREKTQAEKTTKDLFQYILPGLFSFFYYSKVQSKALLIDLLTKNLLKKRWIDFTPYTRYILLGLLSGYEEDEALSKSTDNVLLQLYYSIKCRKTFWLHFFEVIIDCEPLRLGAYEFWNLNRKLLIEFREERSTLFVIYSKFKCDDDCFKEIYGKVRSNDHVISPKSSKISPKNHSSIYNHEVFLRHHANFKDNKNLPQDKETFELNFTAYPSSEKHKIPPQDSLYKENPKTLSHNCKRHPNFENGYSYQKIDSLLYEKWLNKTVFFFIPEEVILRALLLSFDDKNPIVVRQSIETFIATFDLHELSLISKLCIFKKFFTLLTLREMSYTKRIFQFLDKYLDTSKIKQNTNFRFEKDCYSVSNCLNYLLVAFEISLDLRFDDYFLDVMNTSRFDRYIQDYQKISFKDNLSEYSQFFCQDIDYDSAVTDLTENKGQSRPTDLDMQKTMLKFSNVSLRRACSLYFGEIFFNIEFFENYKYLLNEGMTVSYNIVLFYKILLVLIDNNEICTFLAHKFLLKSMYLLYKEYLRDEAEESIKYFNILIGNLDMETMWGILTKTLFILIRNIINAHRYERQKIHQDLKYEKMSFDKVHNNQEYEMNGFRSLSGVENLTLVTFLDVVVFFLEHTDLQNEESCTSHIFYFILIYLSAYEVLEFSEFSMILKYLLSKCNLSNCSYLKKNEVYNELRLYEESFYKTDGICINNQFIDESRKSGLHSNFENIDYDKQNNGLLKDDIKDIPKKFGSNCPFFTIKKRTDLDNIMYTTSSITDSDKSIQSELGKGDHKIVNEKRLHNDHYVVRIHNKFEKGDKVNIMGDENIKIDKKTAFFNENSKCGSETGSKNGFCNSNLHCIFDKHERSCLQDIFDQNEKITVAFYNSVSGISSEGNIKNFIVMLHRFLYVITPISTDIKTTFELIEIFIEKIGEYYLSENFFHILIRHLVRTLFKDVQVSHLVDIITHKHHIYPDESQNSVENRNLSKSLQKSSFSQNLSFYKSDFDECDEHLNDNLSRVLYPELKEPTLYDLKQSEIPNFDGDSEANFLSMRSTNECLPVDSFFIDNSLLFTGMTDCGTFNLDPNKESTDNIKQIKDYTSRYSLKDAQAFYLYRSHKNHCWYDSTIQILLNILKTKRFLTVVSKNRNLTMFLFLFLLDNSKYDLIYEANIVLNRQFEIFAMQLIMSSESTDILKNNLGLIESRYYRNGNAIRCNHFESDAAYFERTSDNLQNYQTSDREQNSGKISDTVQSLSKSTNNTQIYCKPSLGIVNLDGDKQFPKTPLESQRYHQPADLTQKFFEISKNMQNVSFENCKEKNIKKISDLAHPRSTKQDFDGPFMNGYTGSDLSLIKSKNLREKMESHENEHHINPSDKTFKLLLTETRFVNLLEMCSYCVNEKDTFYFYNLILILVTPKYFENDKMKENLLKFMMSLKKGDVIFQFIITALEFQKNSINTKGVDSVLPLLDALLDFCPFFRYFLHRVMPALSNIIDDIVSHQKDFILDILLIDRQTIEDENYNGHFKGRVGGRRYFSNRYTISKNQNMHREGTVGVHRLLAGQETNSENHNRSNSIVNGFGHNDEQYSSSENYNRPITSVEDRQDCSDMHTDYENQNRSTTSIDEKECRSGQYTNRENHNKKIHDSLLHNACDLQKPSDYDSVALNSKSDSEVIPINPNYPNHASFGMIQDQTDQLEYTGIVQRTRKEDFNSNLHSCSSYGEIMYVVLLRTFTKSNYVNLKNRILDIINKMYSKNIITPDNAHKFLFDGFIHDIIQTKNTLIITKTFETLKIIAYTHTELMYTFIQNVDGSFVFNLLEIISSLSDIQIKNRLCEFIIQNTDEFESLELVLLYVCENKQFLGSQTIEKFLKKIYHRMIQECSKKRDLVIAFDAYHTNGHVHDEKISFYIQQIMNHVCDRSAQKVQTVKNVVVKEPNSVNIQKNGKNLQEFPPENYSRYQFVASCDNSRSGNLAVVNSEELKFSTDKFHGLSHEDNLTENSKEHLKFSDFFRNPNEEDYKYLPNSFQSRDSDVSKNDSANLKSYEDPCCTSVKSTGASFESDDKRTFFQDLDPKLSESNYSCREPVKNYDMNSKFDQEPTHSEKFNIFLDLPNQRLNTSKIAVDDDKTRCDTNNSIFSSFTKKLNDLSLPTKLVMSESHSNKNKKPHKTPCSESIEQKFKSSGFVHNVESEVSNKDMKDFNGNLNSLRNSKISYQTKTSAEPQEFSSSYLSPCILTDIHSIGSAFKSIVNPGLPILSKINEAKNILGNEIHSIGPFKVEKDKYSHNRISKFCKTRHKTKIQTSFSSQKDYLNFVKNGKSSDLTTEKSLKREHNTLNKANDNQNFGFANIWDIRAFYTALDEVSKNVVICDLLARIMLDQFPDEFIKIIYKTQDSHIFLQQSLHKLEIYTNIVEVLPYDNALFLYKIENGFSEQECITGFLQIEKNITEMFGVRQRIYNPDRFLWIYNLLHKIRTHLTTDQYILPVVLRIMEATFSFMNRILKLNKRYDSKFLRHNDRSMNQINEFLCNDPLLRRYTLESVYFIDLESTTVIDNKKHIDMSLENLTHEKTLLYSFEADFFKTHKSSNEGKFICDHCLNQYGSNGSVVGGEVNDQEKHLKGDDKTTVVDPTHINTNSLIDDPNNSYSNSAFQRQRNESINDINVKYELQNLSNSSQYGMNQKSSIHNASQHEVNQESKVQHGRNSSKQVIQKIVELSQHGENLESMVLNISNSPRYLVYPNRSNRFKNSSNLRIDTMENQNERYNQQNYYLDRKNHQPIQENFFIPKDSPNTRDSNKKHLTGLEIRLQNYFSKELSRKDFFQYANEKIKKEQVYEHIFEQNQQIYLKRLKETEFYQIILIYCLVHITDVLIEFKNIRIQNVFTKFLTLVFQIIKAKEHPLYPIALNCLIKLTKYEVYASLVERDFGELFLSPDFFDSNNCTIYSKYILYKNTLSRNKTILSTLFDRLESRFFVTREFETIQKTIAFKKLSFVLFCGEKDQYLSELNSIIRMISLNISTDVNKVKLEILSLIRMCIQRFSSDKLYLLWPIIVGEINHRFLNLESDKLEGEKERCVDGIFFAYISILDLIARLNLYVLTEIKWLFVEPFSNLTTSESLLLAELKNYFKDHTLALDKNQIHQLKHENHYQTLFTINDGDEKVYECMNAHKAAQKVSGKLKEENSLVSNKNINNPSIDVKLDFKLEAIKPTLDPLRGNRVETSESSSVNLVQNENVGFLNKSQFKKGIIDSNINNPAAVYTHVDNSADGIDKNGNQNHQVDPAKVSKICKSEIFECTEPHKISTESIPTEKYEVCGVEIAKKTQELMYTDSKQQHDFSKTTKPCAFKSENTLQNPKKNFEMNNPQKPKTESQFSVSGALSECDLCDELGMKMTIDFYDKIMCEESSIMYKMRNLYLKKPIRKSERPGKSANSHDFKYFKNDIEKFCIHSPLLLKNMGIYQTYLESFILKSVFTENHEKFFIKKHLGRHLLENIRDKPFSEIKDLINKYIKIMSVKTLSPFKGIEIDLFDNLTAYNTNKN